MEAFLASFKKDCQGAITSIGEIKLPPLLSKPTEPSVSTSQFSDDQMFEVDRHISDASQLNWNTMLEYIKASKNTPCASAGNVGANSENPNPTLPISSAPSNDTLVNPYFSHNNQLVPALPSPSPIRSAPYSAAPPSQASYPLGVATVPNHSSAPIVQANFMANAPTAPAPPV